MERSCVNCKFLESELYDMPCIGCTENPGLVNMFQPCDKKNSVIKKELKK